MPSIVYLASPATLPGHPERRKDAFEHDATMEALTPAFAAEGWQLHTRSWDDAQVDWSRFDAALVGSTWDYWDRYEPFLAQLAHIHRSTRLFNPEPLLRWNTDKRYLAELAAKGVPTIPTVWLDDPTPAAVTQAFHTLGADDLVVKRQVGAGAFGQHRLHRGDPIPELPHRMMAQPFLPAIQAEGELSFVVIDGALSHALVKRASPGDYRIQSFYGGKEAAITPAPEDAAAALAVVSTLDEPPLYARVDMVRGADGALKLMELEMVEPYLYPLQGPELGPRLAAAVVRRVGGEG